MIIPYYNSSSYYNQFDSSFMSAGIITIIFGSIVFFIKFRIMKKNLNLQHSFFINRTLSWISIAIFGSLPFIFSSLRS